MGRPLDRKLRSAITRLDPVAGASKGLDGPVPKRLGLAVLEALDNTEARLGRSVDDLVRARTALEQVDEGVVVADQDGTEVYRNGPADAHLNARVAGSLVAAAVTELLANARRQGPDERLLELFLPVRRQLRIRSSPIVNETGPIGSVAVIEDVSERRRVDTIRRDFVANVSHELKTPVGALSLLAETLDGEDDPEVVSRLSSRISAEAARLGRLIDDLLDLSRIEAHEATEWEPVPIHTVIGQSLEAVRPLADAGDIELTVDDPELIDDLDTGVEVLGDGWQLVSALTNLVDNAVKYSEPGGRVSVSVVAIADADGPCSIELSVSDQGIGIPRRDLERIFERFYRVDRARSRSTGGTGLGLSIVRHVAANHGGTVRVVSEEGVGSSFTLALPCTQRVEGPTTSEEPAGA